MKDAQKQLKRIGKTVQMRKVTCSSHTRSVVPGAGVMHLRTSVPCQSCCSSGVLRKKSWKPETQMLLKFDDLKNSNNYHLCCLLLFTKNFLK